MDANVLSACFLPNDYAKEIVTYGNGLINRTYVVFSERGQKLLLQRINNNVFPDVDGLMKNIELVTSYIKYHYPASTTLEIVRTTTGGLYASTNDGYYRVYKFINDTESIEVVKNPHDMYVCGKGFGQFFAMLSGFNASLLSETIKNFHNTESRYKDFLLAAVADKCHRYEGIKDDVEFVTSRKNYASRIVKLLESKLMPLRVTHNDTKLNNLLLSKDKNNVIAVIDLDTVMPGSVCYDFGDSIRIGCNTTREDDPDLNNVHFNFEFFKEYARGYLECTKDKLTQVELDNLAFSGILLTYECGMRFLTDYLNGDTYFRINHPTHNLERARNQFKLVSEMEKMLPEMEAYIKELCK